MAYDYLEAMKKDIREWINDNEWLADHELDEDELYDAVWDEDSVTGNGCWGYPEEVKQYVLDNTALCMEALREFCVSAETVVEKFFDEDWAYLDATIRCYLLGSAIYEVIQEIDRERKEVV